MNTLVWVDKYLHKTITEVDLAEVVSSGKVTVEGSGVELGEDEHFVDSTVDAVAHGHIDQPVSPSNWHLKMNSQFLPFKVSWNIISLRCFWQFILVGSSK